MFFLNSGLLSFSFSRKHNISYRIVQRVMHKENMYPYKTAFLYELSEGDPNRRVEFCGMMNRLDSNEIWNPFFNSIIKLIDTTIYIGLSYTPPFIREFYTQYPRKLNFNVNQSQILRWNFCLQFLQDELIPSLGMKLMDDDLH